MISSCVRWLFFRSYCTQVKYRTREIRHKCQCAIFIQFQACVTPETDYNSSLNQHSCLAGGCLYETSCTQQDHMQSMHMRCTRICTQTTKQTGAGAIRTSVPGPCQLSYAHHLNLLVALRSTKQRIYPVRTFPPRENNWLGISKTEQENVFLSVMYI